MKKYFYVFTFASASAQMLYGVSIDYNKEMAIANRYAIGAAVVSDPQSPGSAALGNLLTRMLPNGTNKKVVGQFIYGFFHSWAVQTLASGIVVVPRPKMDSVLVAPWASASMARKDGPCAGISKCLDPLLAPFRLISVMYRPDLASCNGNAPTQAGEVRYVFGINAQPGPNPLEQIAVPVIPYQGTEGSPQSRTGNILSGFTIIVENGLPIGRSASGVVRTAAYWANRFHQLAGLACASGNCSGYANALAGIIKDTTSPGIDSTKPNGFPLNHFRTNEVLTSPTTGLWEIRSFRLNGSGTSTSLQLEILDDKTPRDGLDGAGNGLNLTSTLLEWVNANGGAIRDQKYSLPASMRAATSHPSRAILPGLPDGGFQWLVENAGGLLEKTQVPESDRFLFAMNTCNGCHSDERRALYNLTQPNTISGLGGFYHVDPTVAPTEGNDIEVFSHFVQVQHKPTRVKAAENALDGLIDKACSTSVPHFVPPGDFAF